MPEFLYEGRVFRRLIRKTETGQGAPDVWPGDASLQRGLEDRSQMFSGMWNSCAVTKATGARSTARARVSPHVRWGLQRAEAQMTSNGTVWNLRVARLIWRFLILLLQLNSYSAVQYLNKRWGKALHLTFYWQLCGRFSRYEVVSLTVRSARTAAAAVQIFGIRRALDGRQTAVMGRDTN